MLLLLLLVLLPSPPDEPEPGVVNLLYLDVILVLSDGGLDLSKAVLLSESGGAVDIAVEVPIALTFPSPSTTLPLPFSFPNPNPETAVYSLLFEL